MGAETMPRGEKLLCSKGLAVDEEQNWQVSGVGLGKKSF